MSVAAEIARRAASYVNPGEVVNLGIGIPTFVAEQLPEGSGVVLQSENGMLGLGPAPLDGEIDPDLVNASKLPVGELPGASYFSSSSSFAMIRGGHVDVAILGALEVDESGRLANWAFPGRTIFGVGGAMDLLVGARRVIVAATHLTREGKPKLVRRSDLPLSGDRIVDLVVTDKASFAMRDGGMQLIEIAEGTTMRWIEENTEARFTIGPELAVAA
jgi:3-oxoacid CoA-transferase B subunit